LPALFVVLVVVMAWVTIGDPSQLDTLRGETVASAFFFSNWWFIFQDVSYFQQFGPPSPLGHIWSLGVEEQFYILWPWMLLGGLALFGRPVAGGRGGRRSRLQPKLALITLGLALVSIILMAVLFKPGADSTRAYEGTDTRAFGLLIGAALAMVWPSRRLIGAITAQARRTLDLIGAAGLVLILVLIATTSEFSPFIYRGGLVILSVATAMVVASVAHPSSRIGLVLGVMPLRWIGVRSYGIYLWQSPIILLTTPVGAGFSLSRAVVQVGATFLIAALSWKYVEDPIRHGAIGKLWRRARTAKFRVEKPELTPGGWAGVGATGLVCLFALLGFAGVTFSKPILPIAVTNTDPLAGLGKEKVALTVGAGGGDPAAAGGPVEADPSQTACRSVAYIGESTSLGMILPEILPDPGQRLDARLGAVGAGHQKIDIAGSRSVFDSDPGTASGSDAAQAIRDSGFTGCWVFALGINDSGFVAADPNDSNERRIDTMMSIADGEPVMWVNAKMLQTGPLAYLHSDVEKWDQALVDACPRYPEMRIYDWADEARKEWFSEDGIHYGPDGYAERGRLIAAGLVSAFPSGTPIPEPQSAGAAGATGTSGATGDAGTETGDPAGTTGPAGASPNCLVGAAPAALNPQEPDPDQVLSHW